jgi:hypothetical protein
LHIERGILEKKIQIGVVEGIIKIEVEVGEGLIMQVQHL